MVKSRKSQPMKFERHCDVMLNMHEGELMDKYVKTDDISSLSHSSFASCFNPLTSACVYAKASVILKRSLILDLYSFILCC